MPPFRLAFADSGCGSLLKAKLLQQLETIFYENEFSTKSYSNFLSGWQD